MLLNKPIFVCYSKCSTCAKARNFLIENHIEFVERPIKEQNPTADELKEWVGRSGLPIKRFFNTSGLVYRSLDIKNKYDTMTDDERYEILSSDGMLVKRPILITDNGVFAGFKEDVWKNLLEI